MALNSNDIPEELAAMLDVDFTAGLDEELTVEPNQPLPSVEQDDKDEFDLLLDEFINSQLKDVEDEQEELAASISDDSRPLPDPDQPEDEFAQALYPEERQLFEAFVNFRKAVYALADNAKLERPQLNFSAQQIYRRYRPSRDTSLNDDIYNAWTLMLAAQPVRLSNLPPKATDEQILEYAEKTSDENLQMALISYVEILIELEGCEIAYNMRKAKSERRKIEKAIYEEHKRRQERMKAYIEAIKKQDFPIDAERLVTNYFKTAKKDPDGAQKMLENNPATFAPIQIDKLKPRFFGMIKPKPEDGIRVNKEIGKFLKDLKA